MQCIYNYNIVCVLQDLEWLVALFFQLSVPALAVRRRSMWGQTELDAIRALLCESSEEEQALVPLLLNSNSHLELGRPTRLQNSRPKKTKATLCEQ